MNIEKIFETRNEDKACATALHCKKIIKDNLFINERK